MRDLPKDNHAIDIEHGFKPTYVVSADKKEVVAQLKKLAKEAEMVWLASATMTAKEKPFPGIYPKL